MSDVDLTGLTEKRNRKGTRYYIDVNNRFVAKECVKCEKVKVAQEFHKDASKLGGRDYRCKECVTEYKQKHFEKNREEVLGRERKHSKKYYEGNREYFQNYYESNKTKILFRNREYYFENTQKHQLVNLRRRARLRNLPDNLTSESRDKILDYFKDACALTGKADDVHLDHVIPISIGHGGTTYENVVPLNAELNMSKSNRCIFDWFADNRERFDLTQSKFDELIEYLADINEMTTTEYEEYVRWSHDNPRSIEELEELAEA